MLTCKGGGLKWTDNTLSIEYLKAPEISGTCIKMRSSGVKKSSYISIGFSHGYVKLPATLVRNKIPTSRVKCQDSYIHLEDYNKREPLLSKLLNAFHSDSPSN